MVLCPAAWDMGRRGIGTDILPLDVAFCWHDEPPCASQARLGMCVGSLSAGHALLGRLLHDHAIG